MARIRKHFSENTFAAILFCVVMIVCAVTAAYFINEVVESLCFRVLKESAEQGAEDVQILLESEGKHIEILADVFSKNEALTVDICKERLESINEDELVSTFSVLLPDNQVVYADGAEIYTEDTPDFESEKEKAARLTDVFTDTNGEKYVAYTAPIARDGEILGILYGCMKLSRLPETLKMRAFNGECEMYLIDRDTGDYLMDTWHDELGNIYDDYNMAKRNMKEGGDQQKSKENLVAGHSGSLVFTSKTTGDDFYTYYTPVGVYHLSFQITVSRQTAFAEAVQIQKIVYLLCGIQILISMISVAVLLRRIYTKMRRERKNLELNRRINQIQQLLFGAYRNPELLNQALALTAESLGAEQMIFTVFQDDTAVRFYSWPQADESVTGRIIGRNLAEESPETFRQLKEKTTLILNREDAALALNFPNRENQDIQTLAASCVKDADGEVISILNALNIREPEIAARVLETMAVSLQMAQQNIDSYHKIHVTGITDALTGLKNRHAYQQTVSACDADCRELWGCIYIDANGLHELNNRLGHTAGDDLLRTIAGQITALFGAEHAYRIGGDEFVVLTAALTPEEVDARLVSLRAVLKRKDYYVSTGTAFREEGVPFEETILTAEKRMYADKEAFYQNSRHDRRKCRK